MISVKVTFLSTVRRFSIPEDLQIAGLKGKLVEVFPELKGTAPESVLLYYRDTDNDLVTISSDEELRIAEKLVGDDKTLKLLITVRAVPEEKQEEEDDDDMEIDLFDLFFGQPIGHHHYSSAYNRSPFTLGLLSHDVPSWRDRRHLLQQQEERLRRRREYEERMRKAHLEHVKALKEKARIAEEERKKRQASAESKNKVEKAETNQPVLPSFPAGWTVNPFGSWGPVVHKDPSGSTTCISWGPWGYTAYYGGDSNDTEQPQEADKKQPAEQTEQELTDTVPLLMHKKKRWKLEH